MENIIFVIMVVIMLGAGILTCLYESGVWAGHKSDSKEMDNKKEETNKCWKQEF
jgi:hypothetical protein